MTQRDNYTISAIIDDHRQKKKINKNITFDKMDLTVQLSQELTPTEY